MFKFYSIFLSSALLLQSFSFNLNDVAEFAVLASHIAHHLEQGEDIDDFIFQHYGNEPIAHSHENNEHERLPFKQLHVDGNSGIVFIINKQNFVIKLKADGILSTNFIYVERLFESFENNFFIPPRMA